MMQTEDTILPIQLRPMKDLDYGFVLKTYTQELHKIHPWNFIPNNIFFPYYTKLLNSILLDCPVIMANVEGEPDTLVGYVIGKQYNKDNIIIHFANVKGIFRRVGVLKYLISSLEPKNKNIICSHYFDLFKKLKDKYNLIYDPTILEIYGK